MFSSLSLILTTLLTTALASPIVDSSSLSRRQNQVLAGAPISNITVSGGSLVSCQTTTISWRNGVAPFTLSIATGGLYLDTTVLETHEGLTSSSYDWLVAEPQGTGMYFSVTDSSQETGYVQNIYVAANPSGDVSCLPASSSAAASAPASSSSAAAAPASTTSAYTSTVGDVISTDAPSGVSTIASASASSAATSSAGAAGVVVVTVTSTSSTSSSSSAPVSSSSAVPPTTISQTTVTAVAANSAAGSGASPLTLTQTSTTAGAQATLQSALSGAQRMTSVSGVVVAGVVGAFSLGMALVL